METKIRSAASYDSDAIVSLLGKNKLPIEDIDKNLSHFFVATIRNQIVGVIGLEQYADYGLLRSMVIDSSYRKNGIASKLITHLFQHAQSVGLKEMYLLTETAKDYFEKKSFQIIQRNEVPSAVQQSAEFSHVCPASATVMKRAIDKVIS